VPAAELITTALLRERLAHTRAPHDPSDVVLPQSSVHWPRGLVEQVLSTLRPAGVLIPVVDHASEPSVLLTQRSADLKHHAGQISFPGGRMEESDDDVVHAALRETHEEVGIEPEAVAVIGYLDPMATVTGYAVTPVVGLVAPETPLVLDRTEVEYAFEVPLAFLLDHRNELACEREWEGRRIPTSEFHYESRKIWGATAQMLIELRKILIF
jgi:8-oxo-dGTP pyrophosphatase MutT (NUDIX family)